jgi:catechol 2,3-dioxygenase-like lactoylglutathione lyase family enzyme
MIDHVSIAVRDLEGCARFYEAVLGTLGQQKLVMRPGTVGFGKTYPEFWLNERRTMTAIDADTGTHICFRGASIKVVQAFPEAAVQSGGRSDGAPGPRRATNGAYYAAFVRDPEGNKLEAATFAAA